MAVATTKTTSTVDFYAYHQLTDEDPTLLARTVGYYEYSNALRNLDQLIALCDYEELKVLDELVRERPEFGYYSNLARMVQSGPTTLIPPPGPHDDSFRHGLPWVMALARVELGAMLALHVSSRTPFADVKPTAYEAPAYLELLLDGSQFHYWLLENDPWFRRVRSLIPNPEMLARVRHLRLATLMVQAASGLGAELYNGQQVAELRRQNRDYRATSTSLRQRIEAHLQGFSGSNTTTQVDQKLIRACISCLDN